MTWGPCVRKRAVVGTSSAFLARGLAAVASLPCASGQLGLYGSLPSTDVVLLLTDTLLKPDQPWVFFPDMQSWN